MHVDDKMTTLAFNVFIKNEFLLEMIVSMWICKTANVTTGISAGKFKLRNL